jgi:hypothetical protein
MLLQCRAVAEDAFKARLRLCLHQTWHAFRGAIQLQKQVCAVIAADFHACLCI